MSSVSATCRMNDYSHRFSPKINDNVILSSGEECCLKLDVDDIMQSWELLLKVAREETQYSNAKSPTIQIVEIKDERSLEGSMNNMLCDPTTFNTNLTASYNLDSNNVQPLAGTNPVGERAKYKKIGKKRKSSSCSISSSNSTTSSCYISNQEHLTRRRKYKKRKNAAPSNPAQSMMEFHFPVWTFHVE
ncbi:predicted protein [Naegleria gruberi]|uniref:Predicted protein n=1 Tax=Naegleria gruberi TaxID=5762 RepID=D2VRP4_NAEGR|nr:uncharacterized protein NAEGRDRAFT_71657 [Naegleria gruberi]EFC40497.1 predicted protein [Naegleria gruberi]|eukprot:XP_002673241.1 predicted protein [Naegleria gruberi strain NEG-M]